MNAARTPERAAAGGFAVRRALPTKRRGTWRRWTLVLMILALLAAGTWWVMRGGRFAVTRIETGGYRFTDAVALEQALAPLLGRNLWTLGAEDAARALTGLPWIRDLRLHRSLPNVVTIEFREWRPLLALAGAGDLPADPREWVLLEDGRVLPFPAHLPMPALPVLVGVAPAREGAQDDWCLPAEVAPSVIEVVAAMEDAGLETVYPVDFVVAREEGFAIVLQDGQGTLLLGREGFVDRLQRYMTAREHLEPGLEVDLRFRDRITVKEPAVRR